MCVTLLNRLCKYMKKIQSAKAINTKKVIFNAKS